MSEPVACRGPGWWVAVALGIATMGWGGWLFLDATSDGGERLGFALWVVGADLGVDWVVLPVVAAVGFALARWVPPDLRPPMAVGLAVSAVVVGLAWLPLAETAAPVGNDTIQPLDYPRLVLVTIGAVWSAMAIWWALRRRSRDG